MHRVCVPLLILMAAGCGRSGDENLGLSGKRTTVDVAKLTQPEELVRALSLTGKELDGRLGGHRMDATSSVKLQLVGAQPQVLDESFAVQADGRGGVHVVHDNSRGNGFEATALQQDLYVKPRYGKFVRRKIEGDELERLRAVAEGAGAAYLKLLERFVQVREAGTASIAGHPGVKLALSARTSPDSARSESEPGKKWRDKMLVKYIDGDVVLDARSAAPLAVRIETEYTFARDGKPVTATVVYKQTTAGEPGPITAPADWTTLSRPRPMLDKQTLLEGLK